MPTSQTRYVGAKKLLKAIEILPEKIGDGLLIEKHRVDLEALLVVLQKQQPVIDQHQKSFPNQDRAYPIQLNDTQHRFLLGI
jgi:hypothetical protein